MGPFDHFVGELWPGAYGWLRLDSAGTPIAPATIEPPPPDNLACHVTHNPTIPLPDDQDMLLTSSGASISPPMNSNIDKRVELESQYTSAAKPDNWDSPDHRRHQRNREDK
jgi:hypothetical protein